MRITLGPIVQGAAGKLGNQIFSKWKNQPYVKQMPLGVRNPSSDAQNTIRTQLDVFANSWDALLDQEKALWETVGSQAPYVAQSETGIRAVVPVSRAKMSGINAFISFNQKIFSAGGAVVVTTPTIGAPATATQLLTAVSLAGVLTVTWNIPVPVPGADEEMMIWIYDKQRLVHKQLAGHDVSSLGTIAITEVNGFDGTPILLTALVGNRFLVQGQVVNNVEGTFSAPTNTLEVVIA